MIRTLFAALLLASPVLAVGVVPPIPRLPEGKLLPAAPKADPDPAKTEPDEDPATILERITQTADAVSDRLKDKDTGTDTRQRQEQLLKDIDKLLKPPPPMDNQGGGSDMPPPDMPPPPGGMPPPMGMGGGMPPPMGGGGRQKPPRGSRGEGQPPPMGAGGMNEPMPMPKGNNPMGAEPKPGQAGAGNPGPKGGQKSPPALPLDVPFTKEVWGHLPEKARQEVAQYYREQYLPRYNELLKQYYTALAERERKQQKK